MAQGDKPLLNGLEVTVWAVDSCFVDSGGAVDVWLRSEVLLTP